MYTITLTKEQFEQLQSNKTLIINLDEPKQEKWTPSSGKWNISLIDEPYETNIQNKRYTEAGIEYETEEEAAKTSKAIRSYARQLKWLSENEDNFKPDWNNISQQKNYVTYDNRHKIYNIGFNFENNNVNTIYMSENNAEKLCRLLNEGVVEF